jgi:transposase-like protein
MTDDRMALIEAMQKADDGNFLRAVAETVLQIIMDADVEALIGAGRHERSDGRLTYRRYHDVPSGAGAAWGETWNRCRWRTQVA